MTLELFINVSLIVSIDAIILYLIYTVIGLLRIRKQKKSFTSIHEQLKPELNIMLNSGIYGTIKSVSDESITVLIADKTIIKVSRFAVSSILVK